MSLITPLIHVWAWFKKNFVDHSSSAASVAVTLTETLKTLLNNPIAGFLENLIDSVFHTGLAKEIADVVTAEIPKVLAVELAIQGLPDNPTEEQILAFEQSVMKAFSVNSDNSKLYTVLGAQIYGIIKSKLDDGKFTFAEAVQAVQEAYLAYQADLVAYPGVINLPVGTKLPDGNMVVQSAVDAIQDIKSGN